MQHRFQTACSKKFLTVGELIADIETRVKQNPPTTVVARDGRNSGGDMVWFDGMEFDDYHHMTLKSKQLAMQGGVNGGEKNMRWAYTGLNFAENVGFVFF